MISGQRGKRLTCRFSLKAPPPLGLRAPPKTHHRGRGDHDASGDGIPDDDHPPVLARRETCGLGPRGHARWP